MKTESNISAIYSGNVMEAIGKFNDENFFLLNWPFESKKLKNGTIELSVPEICTLIHVKKLKTIQRNIIAYKFVKGFFRGHVRFILLPIDGIENKFRCSAYTTIEGATEGIDEMISNYVFQESYMDYIKQILAASGLIRATPLNDGVFKMDFHSTLFIPSKMNSSRVVQH